MAAIPLLQQPQEASTLRLLSNKLEALVAQVDLVILGQWQMRIWVWVPVDRNSALGLEGNPQILGGERSSRRDVQMQEGLGKRNFGEAKLV